MFYTVYRTTNLVNGKYYFGVHKTTNPDDDYLGSGNYIRRAIAKYGPERFKKEVLFIFDETNAASAFAKEDELIQCYRGRDPLCMNMRKGGEGGFDWINRTGINNKAENGKKANKARIKKIKDDHIFRTRWIEISKKGAAAARASDGWLEKTRKGQRKTWTGRKHKAESIELIRIGLRKITGSRKALYGRRWMTHPELGNKPVKADEILSHQQNGWQFGRVMARLDTGKSSSLENCSSG